MHDLDLLFSKKSLNSAIAVFLPSFFLVSSVYFSYLIYLEANSDDEYDYNNLDFINEIVCPVAIVAVEFISLTGLWMSSKISYDYFTQDHHLP